MERSGSEHLASVVEAPACTGCSQPGTFLAGLAAVSGPVSPIRHVSPVPTIAASRLQTTHGAQPHKRGTKRSA